MVYICKRLKLSNDAYQQCLIADSRLLASAHPTEPYIYAEQQPRQYFKAIWYPCRLGSRDPLISPASMRLWYNSSDEQTSAVRRQTF
jgi:hypothetical protein